MLAWALTEIERARKECDEMWIRAIDAEAYAHDASERMKKLLIRQHEYGRLLCHEAEQRLRSKDKTS